MPTKKAKKHPKMDSLLVSKQKAEIAYVASRFVHSVTGKPCTQSKVKEARAAVGISRAKVYAWLTSRFYLKRPIKKK